MGFLQRLFQNKDKKIQREKYKLGMAKTRQGSLATLKDLLTNSGKIDQSLYDRLEEIFILADIGVDTVVNFILSLKAEVKKRSVQNPKELEEIIVDKLFELYLKNEVVDTKIRFNPSGPTVLLFVGVNGTGKTTSIGKLAYKLKQDGKTVMMAAADTFRAGAIDQLRIWSERVGCPFVAKAPGSDPSSVIFDALRVAKETNTDVLFIDTAGRLQNKVNLMKELDKMNRTIQRELDSLTYETYLVIDATTGQNGLSQAKIFQEITKITGIILTKLDGTAKGGIVLAIRQELGIPISFVGLGEKITDLDVFDIEHYIYGLFADFFD
ncbi:MAG: signal recognition particle-docking protein FtsY [Candidatus Izemoplasmatales bacterium]|jgi:fused signal recognition particle receptor|nr:signal recognition particle-docking protein FtsY [Candidatus Izemoplasmatales bacterium]MDD4355117.1 signal recognition particle-docking protein FtsY [Candidatus Izemoplasmatales bacterium]MDD4987632.1 signal recognition particle-docking protein FtsY [Candidatus Izemoplasmatales bacterium]MDD5601771.1 signal recognition particle-docking protein FtsY [Candidatus Izemoplasmatales bacterium]